MPAIRYVVPEATSSAFVPVPAATTAVVNFKFEVNGHPGTLGIPAPYPEIAGTFNGWQLRSGYSGASQTMPPVMYPQLYYERRLSEDTAGVSIYSDNQMPVPAADPRGRAAVLALPMRQFGQQQVSQPKLMPKWANWLPTLNYGS